MDRFYNDPRPYIGPNAGPFSSSSGALNQRGFVSSPREPTIKYKKKKQSCIGFLARFGKKKNHDAPSKKVIVRGWRSWNMSLAGPHSGIDITSPVMSHAAVLEAEECKETAHCDPSCKPPCKDCACGVYLRYQPPSFDEIHEMLDVGKGRISEKPDGSMKLQIWFSCEALGKVIYGDIAARAEKVQPIFGIVPPTDDDTFRKLKLYLPAFFGPQLQLMKLGKEEIENLKWGEVWEE